MSSEWLAEDEKNTLCHIEDSIRNGDFEVNAFTDTTIVAKRVGTGDYYHQGCAPDGAVEVKAGNEQEMHDPELMRRACIECGRWILTGARALLYQDYCEQQAKKEIQS
jgi:hypothetical protein